METLKNILQWIYDDWSLLIMIAGLVLGIYKKAKAYFDTSNDEKIEQAKREIQQRMLKMVTDAETTYSEWVKAGEIKRSQVISEIFVQYPILNKVVDQEELIVWIDDMIDNALVTLRDVLAENLAEGK